MATIRVLHYDSLPFVNEWVWSEVCLNGTVSSLFLENKAEFQQNKVAKAT